MKATRTRVVWRPTDQQRAEVEAFAVAGYPAGEIAACLGVDAKTLRAHCRDELDFAAMRLTARIAGNVIRAALGAPARLDANGNVLEDEVLPQSWALTFYLKTRGKKLGWSERAEHTGKNGGPIELDYSSLSDEELRALDRARAILGRIAPRGPLADRDYPPPDEG
jgi:predicted transcriptional regulator